MLCIHFSLQYLYIIKQTLVMEITKVTDQMIYYQILRTELILRYGKQNGQITDSPKDKCVSDLAL